MLYKKEKLEQMRLRLNGVKATSPMVITPTGKHPPVYHTHESYPRTLEPPSPLEKAGGGRRSKNEKTKSHVKVERINVKLGA
jgi:hypothetical protein